MTCLEAGRDFVGGELSCDSPAVMNRPRFVFVSMDSWSLVGLMALYTGSVYPPMLFVFRVRQKSSMLLRSSEATQTSILSTSSSNRQSSLEGP